MANAHALRSALLACGMSFILLPVSASAQDYGSGWFGVAEGMRQNLGQQEALRDRMRMSKTVRPDSEKKTAKTKAANGAGAGTEEHRVAPSGTLFVQAAERVMHSARGAAVAPGTDSLLAAAKFQPSSEVRQRVIERFVALVDQGGDLEREKIRDFLSTGRLNRDFNGLLDRLGFDKHNLADVMSAYYVGMWEVSNGRYLHDDQAKAVRNALAPEFVRNTNLVKLTSAQKQEAAETYTLLVMLAVFDYQTLRKGNDAVAAKAFQDTVYRGALRQGVDLRKLDVGERGFVLR
jgi:hypothetical protein